MISITSENCSIHLAIKKEKTKKDPAPFKWVKLKARLESENEARNFIKNFSKEIQEKYDLFLFEKEG